MIFLICGSFSISRFTNFRFLSSNNSKQFRFQRFFVVRVRSCNSKSPQTFSSMYIFALNLHMHAHMDVLGFGTQSVFVNYQIVLSIYGYDFKVHYAARRTIIIILLSLARSNRQSPSDRSVFRTILYIYYVSHYLCRRNVVRQLYYYLSSDNHQSDKTIVILCLLWNDII